MVKFSIDQVKWDLTSGFYLFAAICSFAWSSMAYAQIGEKLDSDVDQSIVEQDQGDHSHLLMFLWRTGRPVALDTGQSSGGSVEYLFSLSEVSSFGWQFGLGSNLAYLTAHEFSRAWSVSHDEWHTDLRLDATYRLGLGQVGISLSGGGAWVIEHRIRHQANRLVDANADLSTLGSFEDEALAFYPMIALTPLTRLRFFNWNTGEMGINVAARIAYRHLGKTVNGSSLLSWSTLIGIYIELGERS